MFEFSDTWGEELVLFQEDPYEEIIPLLPETQLVPFQNLEEFPDATC